MAHKLINSSILTFLPTAIQVTRVTSSMRDCQIDPFLQLPVGMSVTTCYLISISLLRPFVHTRGLPCSPSLLSFSSPRRCA